MHDQLEGGRTLGLFNLINEYKKEAIGIGSDLSLPTESVAREFKQMISYR
jgi:putative transposase